MNPISIRLSSKHPLRYGENPHQQAWVSKTKTPDSLAWFRFTQIQGKQLSFNNYLDIDAAVNYLSFIGQALPACVVIKHTNTSGASINSNISKAFIDAWNSDNLAAFGSIIAINRTASGKLAKLMLRNNRFFEVLACPKITSHAKTIFASKRNLRVLINPALRNPKPNIGLDIQTIRGGFLLQDKDSHKLNVKKINTVTQTKPTKKQLTDLTFAWNICRVSKANAIVIAKNQTLISSGVGQQDRLRCCQLAIQKSPTRIKNSVAASDGFFPFPDGPKTLIQAGIKAIIQPGGSIRDQQTIDLCNQHLVSMVFTGIRCFKH